MMETAEQVVNEAATAMAGLGEQEHSEGVHRRSGLTGVGVGD